MKALVLVPLAALALPPQEAEDAGMPVRPPLPSAEEIAALPPDGGPEFNRLIFEHSPYLLQHARNPVDWYPWGDEAFQRARAEDKPIFLSIGYSTCHWCHVMEHESFEDPEVAALLNSTFVCIKVDREERPDVDQVYMTVTQGMTGSGGWPMTIVMTPDKQPFFAGTYFPKTGRGGRPGLMELVPEIGRLWRENRGWADERAEQLQQWLSQVAVAPPGQAPGPEILKRAFASYQERFDPEYGGFAHGMKFPIAHNLRLLLRYYRRSGDEQALKMVETTLRSMRRGGIWDQVGFGYHRYSTDRRWFLPHFEKMLYDQALIGMALIETYQVTGSPEYRRTAEEIFEYVLRDLTSPEGAFWSAEDADSAGREGRFYLWTLSELKDVLGPDAELAAEVWGATAQGNFHAEAGAADSGLNILYRPRPLAEVAAAHELTQEALESRLETLRQRLFEARERRVHPFKDDKVLTDWNGLMIAALAMGGRAFDEPRYLDAARRAADFALNTLRGDDGRLVKSWRAGKVGPGGVLEDYAYLVWGLIELWEADFDARWLEAAVELDGVMLADFSDSERGGFFTAAAGAGDLIARVKDAYDGALPSGNSVAALNLLRLARLTGDSALEERFTGILEAFASRIEASPSGHAQLLCALDFSVGPSCEVVVVGRPGAEDTQRMLDALRTGFQPSRVVLFRPDGEPDSPLARLAPWTAEQHALEGRATAYVCRDFACRAPTTDVEEMLESLASSD